MNLKTPFIISCVFILLSAHVSLGEETQAKKFGSLFIYSKIGELDIYINNQSYGKTPLEIKEIQIGSYLVQAFKENEIVYEEVIKILEGEITTLVIKERKEKIEEEKGKLKEKQKEEVKLFQGEPYLKIGYMQCLIYAMDYSNYFYSSNIGVGLGYQITFAPSINLPTLSISLSAERGNFNYEGTSWYIMPIMLGASFNFPIFQGFGGKQYMTIGLGYFLTDLRIGGEELSSFGYHIVPYGIEFPVGDFGAVFVETSTSYAENGKLKYILESLMLSGGYKWII